MRCYNEPIALRYSDGIFSLRDIKLQGALKKLLARVLPVAFCVLVFAFALDAKTSLYGPILPANAPTSSFAKLWVSSQKIEAQAVAPVSSIIFIVAAVCLFRLVLHHVPRVQSTLVAPQSSDQRARHQRRFLRPPPALA